MRIYHYISDEKLDMLAGQITKPFWKRLSVAAKIDVSFVEVTLSKPTSQDTRYSKLALVERYLREHEEVGPILDLGDPTKFFAGTALMQWGPYLHHEPTVHVPGEPMVWFAGETGSSLLGLGGSMKHMIGQSQRPVPTSAVSLKAGYPAFTSRSNMFQIRDLLQASEPGESPPRNDRHRRDMVAQVASTTTDALAACKYARIPPTEVEFLAFRLLDGTHGEKDVVLGSPLFVATP